ncbi:MAG: hypothetical protein JOZ08_16610 [Verrucomicrobia bacterium]|nr:hypothetical protein [Verrucomicrobiota bacterium]
MQKLLSLPIRRYSSASAERHQQVAIASLCPKHFGTQRIHPVICATDQSPAAHWDEINFAQYNYYKLFRDRKSLKVLS